MKDGIEHLAVAYRAYPYLPRFREGMGVRLKIYDEKGI